MRKSNVVKAMACFMAATMAITCVPSANVTNGVSVVAEAAEITPIAKFEFGKNLKDSKGNEATLTGGKSTEATTKTEALFKDGALNLDGTYGIKLPASAVPTGEKYTISYTVKVNQSTANTAQIYLHDKADVNNYVNIGRGWEGEGDFMVWSHLQAGGLWGDSGVDADRKAITKQPVGEWHTYTVVVDSASVTIYCDGIEQSKDTNCKYINKGNSDIYIGVNAWDTPFNGEIKNLEIYNSALTKEQVATLLPNACKNVSWGRDTEIPVAGVSFKLTATLEGEVPTRPVTDSVTCSAISADVKAQQNFNGKEYVISVTPKQVGKDTVIVTTGAVEVNGVSVGGTRYEYSFEAVANTCTDLTCLKAEKVNNSTYRYPTYRLKARIGEAFPFTVTAIAANQGIKLDGKFEAKTVSGSSVMVTTGLGEKEDDILYEYDNGIRKTTGNRVLDVLIKEVKAGENAFEFKFGDKAMTMIVEGVANINGTNIGGSTTTPGDTNKPTDTNKPEDTNKPTDTNKPEDTNKPTDTNKPEDTNKPTDTNKPEDTNKPTTTTKKKKKATVKSAKAKKGKKIVSGTIKLSSGKVVKKATVKVYVNNKKKATTKTNNKGKFSVKLSKKLKKGDKVKLVITKSTIKKITKTIKVK